MSFRDIEKSFFDLYWHMDPVAATQAGVPGYDDRYGRFSTAALAPQLAALKSIALALEEAYLKIEDSGPGGWPAFAESLVRCSVRSRHC